MCDQPATGDGPLTVAGAAAAMTRWRSRCGGGRRAGALLFLLVTLLWPEADAACLDDVITADGFRTLLASGGDFDPATVTLTVSECANCISRDRVIRAGHWLAESKIS